MTASDVGLLMTAGLFAGVVNTLAGGGSLIGIAALIFFGLPATVANATNRVGVLVQSVVATESFRRAGVLEPGQAMRWIVPTCVGALLGSWLSVDLDEALFRRVIGAVMIAMLAVILLKPRRWLAEQSEPSPVSLPTEMVGFFGIGVYGGFLQAGVGIFLLGALVLLGGQGLVRGNAVKTLLVAVFTAPALALYVAYDLIHWPAGIALAAGSAAGGWLGSHLTVSWGPTFVRVVLLAVLAVSGVRLLAGG